MPKTDDTKNTLHGRVESMQQSSATPSLQFLGVAEDCCIYSRLYRAVCSCVICFWHGVIATSYFIFNDNFILVHICGNLEGARA